MSLEHDSEPNKVTPLSQARLGRMTGNPTDVTGDKPITEGRLKEVLSEFIADPLVAKLTRIEKSINRMADQFEAIRNGKAEDAALRVTTDHNAADLALAGIDFPREEYYPYTCTLLAEALNIGSHHIQKMIKIFELKGDTKYHIAIRTGIKSETHKYSDATLQRLKQAIESGEHSRPDNS